MKGQTPEERKVDRILDILEQYRFKSQSGGIIGRSPFFNGFYDIELEAANHGQSIPTVLGPEDPSAGFIVDRGAVNRTHSGRIDRRDGGYHRWSSQVFREARNIRGNK